MFCVFFVDIEKLVIFNIIDWIVENGGRILWLREVFLCIWCMMNYLFKKVEIC